MNGRGIGVHLSDTSRRGLTLAWATLFALSMLFQYAVMASPVRALEASSGTANTANNAVIGPCGTVPLDVELIIDRSGSMGETGTASGTPPQIRIFYAKAAAVALVNSLNANGGVGGAGKHHVGLSSFGNSSAGVNLALGSSSAATVNAAINGLVTSGNTPFRQGMAAGAGDMVANGRGVVDGIQAKHIIIFLSDGRPNPDNTTASGSRPTAANIATFKAAADVVYSIGIGTGGTGLSQVDPVLMASLAKPDASFYTQVTTGDQLPALFAGIVQEINCAVPGLAIDKGVSLTNGSGYAASLTTTVGTTVYYRIHVSNTGNVALSGVTLADNLSSLSGCTIPTSLAAGDSFDCKYSDTAKVGTTVNTATADSDETQSVSASATVSVAAAPGLAISKGVSTTNGSGYAASLTTTVGTTVYYRIHVSNTGNVALSGVTLADNLSSLSGCTIPTSLAAGDSFDCKYSDTAKVGTTVNTATADSDETQSVSASATVSVAAAPGLAISKGVSTTNGSGYAASLTTTVGTTVYYRIHVSNTGNVALSGVTLADNLSSLSGCTIPTSLAAGDSFDCKYSDTAKVGTTVNTATADSDETQSVSASATVSVAAAPGLAIDKGVSLTNGSGYAASLTTTVGTTVYYRIHVSNTGNVALSGVTLADNLSSLSGCTIPTSLAAGDSFDCKYSDTAKVGTTVNTATADSAETQSVTDSTTVTVAAVPGLAIDKTFTGNTGTALSNGQAMANVGDTLTYTLSYLLVDATATNGVITDVLPAGLGYVDGSATGGADFTFQGYNAVTRTLTWTADVVEASGSVTYKVTVQEGSFNLPQPLINTATIDSDETAPSNATADVGVQVVLAETDQPPATARPTLPPTDTIDSDAGSSTPGFGLMLALLVLTGIGLVTGPLAPTPRRLRRKEIRRR